MFCHKLMSNEFKKVPFQKKNGKMVWEIQVNVFYVMKSIFLSMLNITIAKLIGNYENDSLED